MRDDVIKEIYMVIHSMNDRSVPTCPYKTTCWFCGPLDMHLRHNLCFTHSI